MATPTPVLIVKDVPAFLAAPLTAGAGVAKVNRPQLVEFIGTTFRKSVILFGIQNALLLMKAIIPSSASRSDAQRMNRLYISYWCVFCAVPSLT